MGFLSVMKWIGFFCICLSNLVSCLPMVWSLVWNCFIGWYVWHLWEYRLRVICMGLRQLFGLCE
jgi:hypothetical protein